MMKFNTNSKTYLPMYEIYLISIISVHTEILKYVYDTHHNILYISNINSIDT